MKIVRDGKEFELTEEEIEKAYRIREHEYLIADILQKLMSKAEDGECSFTEEEAKEFAEGCADRVYNTLQHNDSWYESYWLSIEYTLDDILKSKEMKTA